MEIEMFTEIKAFYLAGHNGMPVSVTSLRARGTKCDTQCTQCGAEEETINHVLFEFPPAIQTWVLSQIPTPPGVFPMSSVYFNFDLHFWDFPRRIEIHNFHG